jgi:hypothetical protein
LRFKDQETHLILPDHDDDDDDDDDEEEEDDDNDDMMMRFKLSLCHIRRNMWK